MPVRVSTFPDPLTPEQFTILIGLWNGSKIVRREGRNCLEDNCLKDELRSFKWNKGNSEITSSW